MCMIISLPASPHPAARFKKGCQVSGERACADLQMWAAAPQGSFSLSAGMFSIHMLATGLWSAEICRFVTAEGLRALTTHRCRRVGAFQRKGEKRDLLDMFCDRLTRQPSRQRLFPKRRGYWPLRRVNDIYGKGWSAQMPPMVYALMEFQVTHKLLQIYLLYMLLSQFAYFSYKIDTIIFFLTWMGWILWDD